MLSYPELIIFDCDGVLVDSEVLSSRVVSETLGHYGIRITPDETATRFSGYTDEAIGHFFAAESCPEIPENFASIVEEATISCFPNELKSLPFVRETLANLNVLFCVASNSRTKRLDLALAATGLDRFFAAECRFSSSLVKNPKPAPELHLLACQKMGVLPEQALVIEDTPTGVTAAVAAGIPVLGYIGASHIADPAHQKETLLDAGAYAVFEDMRQLQSMLKDYTAG
ncbi:HAD-IA family hydrolase [Kiloniella laminariae]|uniref:HAD-IA family hydrolase n=1 Tax=Kiloniella laminariae TaxID=454162 RepID=A0ABT4LKM5_9PROT|nr:HAD-IA family hydrolase [Kiloniella laminariae]MCZ4281627.1 HAD-IA family hydrolase [Kiloniella laminariae]